MIKKSLIRGALVLSAIGFLPSFASAVSPYEHRQQMQQGYGSSSQNSANQAGMQEQQFAAQLSDLHRQVFMNQFNSMQRAEAMALVQAEKGRKYGRKITPDMAVEQVMKSHRGVQTGQGQMMPQSKQYNYSNKGSSYGSQGSSSNQGSSYGNQGSSSNQGSSKYSGSSKNYQSPYYRQQQQDSKANQQRYQYGYDDDKDSMYDDKDSNYYDDDNQGSRNYQYNQPSQSDDNMNNQNSSSTKKKWWQKDSDSSSSSSSQQKKSGYWD